MPLEAQIEVAPLAGAWIETGMRMNMRKQTIWSLPSRERGLKLLLSDSDCYVNIVAPLAGAWIETVIKIFKISMPCRSPRGSVD